MDMCIWRRLPVIVRLGCSTRANDCSYCTSRTACCVVVARLPYPPTSCNQSKGWYQKCDFDAAGLVLLCERQTWVESCDVQFCWWETVSSCFSMSSTIAWKKKMNLCKNYLSTYFNFSLACMSEFTDLGQIKNLWLFPQGSTPLPSLLPRPEWHWTCKDLSMREI